MSRVKIYLLIDNLSLNLLTNKILYKNNCQNTILYLKFERKYIKQYILDFRKK